MTSNLSGQSILGGRLHLLEQRGAGAFGAVYRAQEYALGSPLREVAVKLTHRTRLSPEEAHRHLQEGYTLCRIAAQCPDGAARQHFIQIHELGIAEDAEDRGYLIMEYVRGTRLFDHINAFGNRIPMSTARRYLMQLCRAIHACHSARPPIAHGDLKPDNVLVDERQLLRLVDFGLAAPLDRLTGYAVPRGGCLPYTAPESLLDRTLPQSDLYSLGLIMYELLTGGGPHLHMPEGPLTNVESHALEHKRQLQFPPLREANQSVPQDDLLFEIVERCCRYRHEERFTSAADILAVLEAETTRDTPPASETIIDADEESLSPAESAVVGSPGAEKLSGDWPAQVEDHLRHQRYTECEQLLARADPGETDFVRGCRAICEGRSGRFDSALESGLEPFARWDGRRSWWLYCELARVLLAAIEQTADRNPLVQPYHGFVQERLSRALADPW